MGNRSKRARNPRPLHAGRVTYARTRRTSPHEGALAARPTLPVNRSALDDYAKRRASENARVRANAHRGQRVRATYDHLKLAQLRALGADRKIKGARRMNTAQLIAALNDD